MQIMLYSSLIIYFFVPSVQFKAIISDKIAQMRKIDLEATELQATIFQGWW